LHYGRIFKLKSMKRYVIITGGGQGLRMGTDIPKQFLMLGDRPVIMHCMKKFYDFNNFIEIILALPQEHFSHWEVICHQYKCNIIHKVVAGRKTRFDSVKNALKTIQEPGLVAVHDAVRPLVSIQTIERCFKMAEEKGNAIPIVGINESIRQIKETGSKAVNRDHFKIVQTPQVFKSDILLEAYTQSYRESYTDDASVVESMGHTINLVEGNIENIKITSPIDLVVAEGILSKLSN